MDETTGYAARHKRRIPGRDPTHLDRPQVLRRLDDASTRPVTLVCAGPGYGKTTQLADWARARGAAWYTVDDSDREPATLVAGLLRALGHELPGDLWFAAPGPQAGSAATTEAVAGRLADVLDGAGTRVLVLDDADRLPVGSAGAAVLESLCRQAPPGLRLMLAVRADAPVDLGRLRGQGLVADLDAAHLAFTPAETAALVACLLCTESTVDAAGSVHRLTGGWPGAVRLLADALARLPGAERPAWLAALASPGGRPADDVLCEVVQAYAEPLRNLLPLVAGLPAFAAEWCGAAGLALSGPALRRLVRQGLLQPLEDGRYAVPPLLRAAHPENEAAPGAVPVRRAALDWFVAQGRLGDALRVARGLDAGTLAAFLHQHGVAALAAGYPADVAAAVAQLPAPLVDAGLHRLSGECRQVRGDWTGALADLRRAAAASGVAGGTAAPGAALAWRMGAIHYLRGELVEALDVLCAGQADAGAPPADQARLAGWAAAVHWLRQEHEACRAAAAQALRHAAASADDGALALAHTSAALVAAMDGDEQANLDHYREAERAARRCGDVLALLRIRNNLASRVLEEGRLDAAVDACGEVIGLAEVTGYAFFQALAVHNRGLAYLGLGRLAEAAADFTAAAASYREMGSHGLAYPLMRLADIHRVRGELARARLGYEHALTYTQDSGDVQGTVPARAGLARVLVDEDLDRSEELVRAALEHGPGLSEVEAMLAAGWVALVHGRPEEAARHGKGAAESAGRPLRRARLAEALELCALTEPAPRRDELLAQAADVWRGTGSELGTLTNAYLRARLAGAPSGTAERALRRAGVPVDQGPHAAGPLRWLATADAPPSVRLRTLGGFALLRNGTPVSVEEWRSRKARDLLKLLVTQHGRMVARESVAQALWPDEPPARTANRLSVALSTVRTVLDPGRRFPPDHFVRADKASVGLGALEVDVLDFLSATGHALRHPQETNAREALRDAATGYRGDFLHDDPYLDWAAPLRERARARYLHVLRTLADLALAVSDVDEVVEHLLRLLEHDPYDETAHLRLVGVLRDAGRHGEAGRRYRRYVLLMADLGVAPAPMPAPRGATAPSGRVPRGDQAGLGRGFGRG
ncbi:BTAD domain-containing putative transcriptional regulator [Actinoplanes subtropicus]|uniref:BTAD domain-containing putative transcriptional regulator n=1 Tax=Actinoplanes subtropicus TaxID=543632 RepID=UPI00068DDE28|nr:BTAD domain-containing putative transcriptional regulator [Actinoplanes subtropicus]